MVTFPSEFISTKFPGYYWNSITKTLFSIKSGTLKELKKEKPSYFNNLLLGYSISDKGYRRFMSTDYLESLTPSDTVVLVQGYGYQLKLIA